MNDEIRRAQRAHLMLNDDLFKEAIKALRDKAMDDFKGAALTDIDALQLARVTYEVTERFLNIFAGYVRDGRFAALKSTDEKVKASAPGASLQ